MKNYLKLNQMIFTQDFH